MGKVGYHGRVQGIGGTEPISLDIGAQRVQAAIRAPAAGLCPGHQQRLEHLRHALRRQIPNSAFGVAPVPASSGEVGQIELSDRIVGLRTCQSLGLRPVGQQASQERLLL